MSIARSLPERLARYGMAQKIVEGRSFISRANGHGYGKLPTGESRAWGWHQRDRLVVHPDDVWAVRNRGRNTCRYRFGRPGWRVVHRLQRTHAGSDFANIQTRAIPRGR